MATLQNRTRAWGFMQSESNWARSRERVVIDGSTGGELGKTLFAGTLLGKISSSGKYVVSPKTGSDGSQTAIAILGEDVTVTEDVIVAVLARDAEVRSEDLTYDSSVATLNDQQAKWVQLAAAGVNIIVRQMGGVQVG